MSDKPDKKVSKIEAKKGESLEKLLEEKGILFRHAEQIREYNRGLKWIIMLRPINKEVAGKLKLGARGKIISIKGKSSEFVFLAGDVPYKAELSKLGKNGEGSDWDKITHFNSVNKKSIEDSDNEKVKPSKRQVIEKKQKIEERKQKIEEYKQQIEEFESKINKIKELGKEDLLPKLQQQLTKAKQELEKKQKELIAEQQTLERYIQEFNLSFKLNKIQKTVEINGETYKCFYKVGENERPEYENIDKLGTQPVIYIKDKNNNYFKVEYGNSERGWNIDKDNPQKIDTKSIKKLKIFSYEQYEKCAVDGENRIRIDNTTDDKIGVEGYEIKEYYKSKNDPKKLYIKVSKNNIEEYYALKSNSKNLPGQEGIYTYEIDDSGPVNVSDSDLKKLETTYEVINPPLTADYDQLSAAQIYNEDDQKFNANDDIDSIVAYLKKEQKKLISFPADKYLKKCKNAAKRLSDNKGESYKNIDEDINLLSEVSEVMAQIKQHDSLTEEGKKKIVQESDILRLKLSLLGVCGKSVTENTMKLGSILDYGISHGLEILHYPPEPIKLRHVDNESDEEFLVIDGEGNPRVAKNLEGVLFFMNDQRNKGICCLEPNPLWPIKINLDKSPHEIQVDENSNSPLLINGFYTGIVELQKELKMKPFTDKFMYAERLMLNSDFVPNIKLPDDVEKEDVRMEIEANNLIEAYKYYGYVLKDLKSLKEKVKEKKYDENFIKFCQEQRLSDLETNDVVLGIFRKKEVKKYFKNNSVESLVKNLNKIEQLSIDKNIKDDVTKILMNDKIKKMLLSKPDNYDLKAKIFDILPNINLLKGFEIKKEETKSKKSGIKNKSKNFLDCLDDYIELIVDRREQLMNRLSHVIDVEHLIFRDIDVKIDNLNSEITKNKSTKSKLEDKVEKLEIKRKRIMKYYSKLDKLRSNGKEINNYWRRMVIEEKNRKKLPNRSVVGSSIF